MPTYEYACIKCGATTEVFATISEKEAGPKPVSPVCRSRNMAQFFGQINVLETRGLGGCPGCDPRSGCCG